MRRLGPAFLCVLIIVPTVPEPVAAQSFGSFFSGRPYRSRPLRRRKTAAIIAIPMPVPRPHFPVETNTPPKAVTSAEPKPVEVKPVEPKPAESKPAESKPAEAAASVPTETQATPLPPPKPSQLVQPPAPDSGKAEPTKPAIAPSGANTAFVPRSPDADPSCLGRLKARHVTADPVAIRPQPDARCTVIQAVSLTSLAMPDGGKVDFPDHPTIACTTADIFSVYVRDLLLPLAKGSFGSPVAAVSTGPGLECRSRDHIFGAKLSAHGQGLAIDIAQLKLADGRVIAVGEPKNETDGAFEMAARTAACGYFHTVLGPGSDSYHRTHWHFDLEVRGSKGDSKFCQ